MRRYTLQASWRSEKKRLGPSDNHRQVCDKLSQTIFLVTSGNSRILDDSDGPGLHDVLEVFQSIGVALLDDLLKVHPANPKLVVVVRDALMGMVTITITVQVDFQIPAEAQSSHALVVLLELVLQGLMGLVHSLTREAFGNGSGRGPGFGLGFRVWRFRKGFRSLGPRV